MNAQQTQEYARQVLINLSSMLKEVTGYPDGTSRSMPSELTAGVVVAQSNMAIAAALMWLAAELKDHR